ncbi:MAG: hypothetical protein AAB803_00280 [Patescibacteria group bacterium]
MKASAIVLVSFVLLAGAGVFFITKQKAAAPTSEQPIVLLRPTPTPIPREEASIDGTKKLRLQAARQTDGSTTYLVFTADANGANQHLIFQKTLAAGTSLDLHNSWSPDGTYVFLIEKGPAGEKFLVLQSTGAAFADGQTALDVGALFDARKTGYLFDKVTGWASPTLLIIYTKTEQGAKGPSYWLELPSRAFLQLAR